MSGELATVVEIEATSAPSSIILDLYRGQSGVRGAYVIPGLGDPRSYDFANSYILDNDGIPQQITPRTYDWFLNLEPTSPTYLTTFILKKNNIWEPEFKVIPNTHNTNRVIALISGSAQTDVVVSNEKLLLSQAFGDQSNKSDLSILRIPGDDETSTSVDSEQEMLAISGSEILDYAYRTDLSQFFRLTALPATSIDNWQPELSINADIDLENPAPNDLLPIISSFKLGMPTYDGSNYTFPITIKGSQLNPEVIGGLETITGTRVAHISVSVI